MDIEEDSVNPSSPFKQNKVPFNQNQIYPSYNPEMQLPPDQYYV